MPILEGFFVGLGMIIFLGPVFFTLLQAALKHGFFTGFMVALGIFISDIVCVVLCFWGSNTFLKNIESNVWIGILGAVILFSIGLKYLIKPDTNIELEEKKNAFSIVGFFAKGFAVNFINPFVFGVWLTIITLAKEKYSDFNDVILFLGAALLSILLTDSLKALLANYLKRFLQPAILSKVYKVIGVLLVVFGIRILFYLFG